MYWYTRDMGDRDAAEAAELLAVKQREEDLMAEVFCMHTQQSMQISLLQDCRLSVSCTACHLWKPLKCHWRSEESCRSLDMD